MANEFIGSGVTFGFNTVGAPSTYTTLAGVTSIDVPALESDDINVTALDSTGQEFIQGLGDGGTLSFPLNLRKATSGAAPWVASQTAFEAYSNDNVLHGFKITFPGSTTVVYSFSGFVKKFAISGVSATSAATADVSIKISGAVTKA